MFMPNSERLSARSLLRRTRQGSASPHENSESVLSFVMFLSLTAITEPSVTDPLSQFTYEL
jgi:hypothetical protein